MARLSHAPLTGYSPLTTGPMSPEEFERIKAEEKAHLRKLRALKQQHRDAQRKVSTLKAVQGLRDEKLEAETDALTEKLMRGAATSEARFEIASEGAADAAKAEADAEALRQAEAAALVQQLKAAAGDRSAPTDDAGTPVPGTAGAAPSAPKTIGRTPPADEPDAPASRGAKTIGRRNG